MKRAVFFFAAGIFFAIPFTLAETGITMTIQQAKEKHQAALLALPGVVSIGIGLSGGETVIKIGLDGKHPDTEKVLPKALEGYRVVSQHVGAINAK